jgi:FkbH-like protein
MYYFGKFLFGKALIPALCEEYMRYIRLKCFSPRKCLVLDLDNTLWGGIVGEDGPEGIQLGDDPPGNSFKEFQRLLLGFHHRGILLAINSRNNPEDVWECILNHPHMVLSKKHFAAAQINWDDKVTNMRRLAEELNIGLESFVFVDDDSYNREMVREALPMVQVIDLPLDPAEYVNVLLNEAHFDVLTITDEDAKRGEYYLQEKDRTVFAQRYENIEDYLRSLDIQVTVNFVDNYSLSRVSQLTMRTNQFNMTTRRYSESDIRKLASSSRHRIYTASMCDRFGDNGIVGIAIVELLEYSWRLDTFLMSCRVLGRGCETALLAVITDDACQHGTSRLLGEFIPTRKNEPAKKFFETHGFILKRDTGEYQNWELNLQTKQIPVPDYIKLIRPNPTEQSNQEQAPKSK